MRPAPLVESIAPGACPPPAALFPAFAVRRGCVFLDTALPSPGARHSILACEPDYVVKKYPDGVRIAYADCNVESFPAADAISLLRGLLSAHSTAQIAGLPFAGGAIGYFGYEYGSALDGVPAAGVCDQHTPPELAFWFYL